MTEIKYTNLINCPTYREWVHKYEHSGKTHLYDNGFGYETGVQMEGDEPTQNELDAVRSLIFVAKLIKTNGNQAEYSTG